MGSMESLAFVFQKILHKLFSMKNFKFYIYADISKFKKSVRGNKYFASQMSMMQFNILKECLLG